MARQGVDRHHPVPVSLSRCEGSRPTGHRAALATSSPWRCWPAPPRVPAPRRPPRRAPRSPPRPAAPPARRTRTRPPAAGRRTARCPAAPHLASRGLVAPAGAPKLPAELRAHGWILADLDSGAVLAARDPHGRYQPASILKVLTALTVAAAAARPAGGDGLAGSGRAPRARRSGCWPAPGTPSTSCSRRCCWSRPTTPPQALAEANGGVAAHGGPDERRGRPAGRLRHRGADPVRAGRLAAADLGLRHGAGAAGRASTSPGWSRYDRLPSAGFPPRASRYGQVGATSSTTSRQNFLDLGARRAGGQDRLHRRRPAHLPGRRQPARPHAGRGAAARRAACRWTSTGRPRRCWTGASRSSPACSRSGVLAGPVAGQPAGRAAAAAAADGPQRRLPTSAGAAGAAAACAGRWPVLLPVSAADRRRAVARARHRWTAASDAGAERGAGAEQAGRHRRPATDAPAGPPVTGTDRRVGRRFDRQRGSGRGPVGAVAAHATQNSR